MDAVPSYDCANLQATRVLFPQPVVASEARQSCRRRRLRSWDEIAASLRFLAMTGWVRVARLMPRK